MEATELQTCRARLQHLIALGAPARGGLLDWNRARLDRILAEHLLRRGHMATAAQLVSDSGLEVRRFRDVLSYILYRPHHTSTLPLVVSVPVLAFLRPRAYLLMSRCIGTVAKPVSNSSLEVGWAWGYQNKNLTFTFR